MVNFIIRFYPSFPLDFLMIDFFFGGGLGVGVYVHLYAHVHFSLLLLNFTIENVPFITSNNQLLQNFHVPGGTWVMSAIIDGMIPDSFKLKTKDIS